MGFSAECQAKLLEIITRNLETLLTRLAAILNSMTTALWLVLAPWIWRALERRIVPWPRANSPGFLRKQVSVWSSIKAIRGTHPSICFLNILFIYAYQSFPYPRKATSFHLGNVVLFMSKVYPKPLNKKYGYCQSRNIFASAFITSVTYMVVHEYSVAANRDQKIHYLSFYSQFK